MRRQFVPEKKEPRREERKEAKMPFKQRQAVEKKEAAGKPAFPFGKKK